MILATIVMAANTIDMTSILVIKLFGTPAPSKMESISPLVMGVSALNSHSRLQNVVGLVYR
jgi:hypothetical protein